MFDVETLTKTTNAINLYIAVSFMMMCLWNTIAFEPSCDILIVNRSEFCVSFLLVHQALCFKS